jgi:hypothetical protein
MSPADQESIYRAIEIPIASYAELVDSGAFAAVGRLLPAGTRWLALRAINSGGLISYRRWWGQRQQGTV